MPVDLWLRADLAVLSDLLFRRVHLQFELLGALEARPSGLKLIMEQSRRAKIEENRLDEVNEDGTATFPEDTSSSSLSVKIDVRGWTLGTLSRKSGVPFSESR